MKNAILMIALLCLGACKAPRQGQFVHYHGKKCEVVAKFWKEGRWVFHLKVPGRPSSHIEFVPEEYVSD
jgi:hypothetical protein